MTTPGGVPNLPPGALTLDTLASKTQDMSTTAMKARAVGRFPSIMDDSTGLSANSEITPFGILTTIFSAVNSLIANADPADVTGPDDLPTLVIDWIESLPFVGEFVELLEAILGNYTGTDTTLLAVQEIFAPIRAIVTALSALTDVDITDPSSILAALEALGGNLGAVVEGLFGIDGGSDPLAALTQNGTNLMALLGNPNLNIGTGSFDPIGEAENLLQEVLTPAGALSSLTQVPTHLLGNINLGNNVTMTGFSQPINNVLPDPTFSNAELVQGGGAWVWDGTTTHTADGSGSIKTTGASVVRQFVGVPIATTVGQVSDLGAWVKWTGLTASSGKAVCLVASAYDSTDALITDTNRIVASVSTPGSSSSGYTGTDSSNGSTLTAVSGWVQLVGTYQAPTGTANVRLTLEVESNVSAGSVWYDDCVQSLRGSIDASLFGNLPGLQGQWDPTTALGGFLDTLTMADSLQHILDGLGSAYSAGGTVSGLDYTDLFTLAQSLTSSALVAKTQSVTNTLVLGQRTNKPAVMGANPTSLTSMTLGHFSNPATGALTTTTLTAGNATAQRFTVPEVATNGFLEFMASGSSVTNIFVNIFKINATTNAKTALFNSSNIASLIPSSVNHVRTLLPSFPTVNPGDELLLEIVNGGTNALTLVTKTTGAPNNTNEVIQNIGFQRATSAGGNSPTSLTSGQGAYSGTVPYVVIGIANVPANYHPPEIDNQTVAGSYSGTLPSWLYAGNKVTIIGIGGGGAGGSSLFYAAGQGGGSAAWTVVTLIVGTDIGIGSNYSFVVGARGAHVTGQGGGTTPGVGGNGNPGGNTTFTYLDPAAGSHTITFTGGQWGAVYGGTNSANSNGTPGQAAGSATYEGATYPGGTSVSAGSTGQSPGGGGGGAGSYGEGGDGGVGQVTLVLEQYP